jgi:hypothetical protein
VDLVAAATYDPEPAAVAAARRFVREMLTSWELPGGDGLLADAELLTSELVTNAVVHAQTPVQVTCRADGSEVEVSVLDWKPGSPIHGSPGQSGDAGRQRVAACFAAALPRRGVTAPDGQGRLVPPAARRCRPRQIPRCGKPPPRLPVSGRVEVTGCCLVGRGDADLLRLGYQEPARPRSSAPRGSRGRRRLCSDRR